MAAVDITPALVRRLVSAQVPQLAELTVQTIPNEGFSNRTFRLGGQFSVRLPRAKGYEAAIAKEAEWLPYLKRHVPLAIPEPVYLGAPTSDYPFHWGIYRWVPGDFAAAASGLDHSRFARALAVFLSALQSAPLPAPEQFDTTDESRGKPLSRFDAQVRKAIHTLGQKIDAKRITRAWEQALASEYAKAAVWVHGDVAPGNLLVNQGKLSAVIDFGSLTVGDPACDLAIAWTFLDEPGRVAFRSALKASDELWARGRGWALWKALILEAGQITSNALETAAAPRVIALVENGA